MFPAMSKTDMSKRLQNRISHISRWKSAENFLSQNQPEKKFGYPHLSRKNVPVGVWP